ncbi:MAG: O-antigen ligase family protein [Candidatus Levyibacteriota bacterium]
MAKKLSLPHILFIFMLTSFVLGEVARIQFPSGIAVKALDLAVLMFIVGSALSFRKKFKKPILTKPILLFLLVASTSLFINYPSLKVEELAVSLSYLVRWIAYAGIYFLVTNFDKDIKNKIPSYLLYMGGAVIGIGFLQYFFYPNLRNLYYLGWDEHLYRLFSTFLDPNFAGAFFVLYFLFTLGFFIKYRKPTYGIFSFMAAVAIILTFSRSAYLMLFVGLVTFLWMTGKMKLIVVFILFFTLITLVLSLAGLRSEGTNLLRTTSTVARLDTARSAVVIFENNPILGVGFNAYEYASKRYGLVEESRYDNHSAAGTDNSVLFILATVGIVGFAAYLYLWFKILLFARSRKGMYSIVLLSSLASLSVGSLFINSLFYTFIMLWMWVLLGLFED